MLVLLALALALIYTKTPWFNPARQKLIDYLVPIHWVAQVPEKFNAWAGDRLASKLVLQEENNALRTEILVLKRKLQQVAAISAENTRLKQLLNSTESLDDRVLVAEIIGVSPDPAKHTVIINRGQSDGLFIGQPLVDATGLVGQVIELGENAARVLLITDTSHALPVQINRNGTRLVAEGQGNLNELYLRFVASTTDIQVGDLLVTSGLGGRFPAGYPVATVQSINRASGKPFATVVAKPVAELTRNRHVLLVFEHQKAVPDPGAPLKTAP